MAWFNWSQTAATNATADPSINWAEGQSPSSVNDSARAMMAATAKYRDDIAGAIVTSGTSTAYTVSTYSAFDTLAHMNGQMIAFTPHATNGDTVTLNVDGLGAKPLRFVPSVELPSNSLILGTPYVATYNNTDGVFYLRGMTSPYTIPLGAGVDYWGTTTPNSAFAFPYGQAVSRTTYATLFSLVGTVFGSGDGSTTFNLPDKRGRASAGKDDMGGSAANRVTSAKSGVSGNGLGSSGGLEVITIAQANLPAVAPTFTGTQGTVTVSTTATNVLQGTIAAETTNGGSTGFDKIVSTTGFASSKVSTGNFTPAGTISNLGSGTATNNMQPTIMCNYIMRII